jgi:hypothetical protein
MRETTSETTQGIARHAEGHKVPDTNRADNYPKAVTSNNKTSRQSSGVRRPVGPPPGKLSDSPTPPVGKQQLQPRSEDVSSSSGFPPSPTPPPVGPPLGKLSVLPGKLTGAPSGLEKRGPATPTNVTVAKFDLYEDVGVWAQQKDQNQKEVR